MKIKSRKQRESEYEIKYGDISYDSYKRLEQELGKNFSEEKLEEALDHIEKLKKVKYTDLHFTFYEVPIQTHRPRANFNRQGLYVPNAKSNADAFKAYIDSLADDLKTICLPMKIKIDAYMPMPSDTNAIDKIIYETKNAYGIGKPDFDNVIKAYCDMIQGSLILDDDLVVSSEFNKYYSLKPRVELDIIFPNGTFTKHEFDAIRSRKSYKELDNPVDISLIVKYNKK